MGLAVNVLGPVTDDKVVISEKRIVKNQLHEKLYLADKDKADKFVKQRKRLERTNNLQTGMSLVLSALVGTGVGKNLKKGGLIGKVGAAVVSGLGSMALLHQCDRALDKNLIKASMNQMGVKQVSRKDLDELAQADAKAKAEAEIEKEPEVKSETEAETKAEVEKNEQ